jgi:hypothetical protein
MRISEAEDNHFDAPPPVRDGPNLPARPLSGLRCWTGGHIVDGLPTRSCVCAARVSYRRPRAWHGRGGAGNIVLASVVKRLGGVQSVHGLREQLQVQPSADMAGISIIAMGPDAGSAASLANTVGIAYQEVAAERASQAAELAVRSIEKVRARRQASSMPHRDPRTAT